MKKLIGLAQFALLVGLLRCSALAQTTLLVAVADGVAEVDVIKKTWTALATGVNMPYGIGFNCHGLGFVSDTGNNAIRTFLSDGTLSPFASGFNYPSGLANGRGDTLMVADYGSGCFYELSAGVQKTVACGYDGPVSIRLREVRRSAQELILTSRGGRIDLLGQASDGTWTNKQAIATSSSYPYDAIPIRCGGIVASEYGRFRIVQYQALADGTINTNPVVVATNISAMGLVSGHNDSLFAVDYGGMIYKFAGTNGTFGSQPEVVVTGLNQPTYAAWAPSSRVRLERQGANAIISWADSACILQSAPSLESMFTNMPDASSPLTNPFTGSMKFFRAVSKYNF